MSQLEKARLAGAISAARSKERKEQRISRYNDNPKLCLECQKPISYKYQDHNYCSRKCSSQLRRRIGFPFINKPFQELGYSAKRSRILYEQNYVCGSCGIPEEWNGKPLRFHMDRINGDKGNETRENLWLICGIMAQIPGKEPRA